MYKLFIQYAIIIIIIITVVSICIWWQHKKNKHDVSGSPIASFTVKNKDTLELKEDPMENSP